ncbi:MAG: hypothetical protein MJB57_03290 [Gemmatimonadetes bacterium]|nr:hypothetical protein [Gemmatimonadota bacterium]
MNLSRPKADLCASALAVAVVIGGFFPGDVVGQRVVDRAHRASTADSIASAISPTGPSAAAEGEAGTVPGFALELDLLDTLGDLEPAHGDEWKVFGETGEYRCGAPASPEEARAAALRAESRALRSNPAVDFEASARTSGTGGDLGLNDEGGTYAGLSWNLLSDGWRENRLRGALLEARAQMAEEDGARAMAEIQIRCVIRELEGRFAPLRLRLARLERETLTELADLKREAYFRGVIRLDELLETDRELERLTRRAGYLAAIVDGLAADASVERFPPVVRLDFDGLLERLAARDAADAMTVLETRALELEDRLEGRTRLRVFARYELENRTNGGEGVSLGMRVQVPLFGADAQAGQDAAIEGVRRRNVLESATRRAEVIAMRRDVEEQVSAAIREHYRYLAAREGARRALSALSVGAAEASVPVATSRVQVLLAVSQERAQTLQLLYERIGRAFAGAQLPMDPSLLEVIDLDEAERRGRLGRRTLYLRSDAFEDADVASVLAFARAKGIESLAVSAERTSGDIGLDALVARARAQGIAVERVLSANEWVDPQNHDRALERIGALESVAGGLQLDIEPDALREHEDDPSGLRASYLALIDRVRAALSADRTLSVSVPLGWPEATYRSLGEQAERVYLMAYGDMDIENRLERARRAVASLPTERVVIALRASDFDDEWEMERTVQAFHAALGVEGFAVHDYRQYRSLSVP